MTTLSVTFTSITEIALIGTFNNWSGDLDFTYDASSNLWIVDSFTITAADQFKVRFNAGWDINLGASGDVEPYVLTAGTPKQVLQNGKNMSATASGAYKVTLNLQHAPYYMTIE
jgi:hypothetical protein